MKKSQRKIGTPRRMKRFFATAIVSYCYLVEIRASDAAQAQDRAWLLWDRNSHDEDFQISTRSIDGFYVSEDTP